MTKFTSLLAKFSPISSQIMSGQQKISAFFTTSAKRPNSDADQNTPPKKAKIIEENQDVKGELTTDMKNGQLKLDVKNGQLSPESDVKNGQLSPEQKDRMQQNKIAALAKLHAKKTNSLLVNFGNSWFKVLENEISKPYFSELSKFVESERSKHTVYPPVDDVFTWTMLCDVNDVKVVILGQDPYHGPKQAHGLCFSVQKDIRPPPSLENMYKELQNDIEGFTHPGHGTLTGWAKQGVLLLNACLTVRAHQANSHKDRGWEKLTDAVISWLNKNKSNLVFILWGSYAQKKGGFIDKKKHLVLKGVHPSPLSAHRGFFGCKHFSKCNDYLKEHGKNPIDWNSLPPQQ